MDVVLWPYGCFGFFGLMSTALKYSTVKHVENVNPTFRFVYVNENRLFFGIKYCGFRFCFQIIIF